jgi:hypothetical protein
VVARRELRDGDDHGQQAGHPGHEHQLRVHLRVRRVGEGLDRATKGNPGWTIDKSGRFGFEGVPFYFNLMDDSGNTAGAMSGQFKSGKSASGDWSLIVNDGTKCSAPWTSSR